MEDKKLPPLPGSDEETLRRDSFDQFYKKRPSEVWQGRIERIEYKEPSKCEHIFIKTQLGAECKRCHFGLTGDGLKVKDGHVYFGKQKLL